jgi:hypothetical protein
MQTEPDRVNGDPKLSSMGANSSGRFAGKTAQDAPSDAIVLFNGKISALRQTGHRYQWTLGQRLIVKAVLGITTNRIWGLPVAY